MKFFEASNFSFFQFVDTLELDEAMNNPKDYDDADAELDGDYRMAEIVDNIGLSTPYEIEGYVYETSYNVAQNIEVFPEDKIDLINNEGKQISEIVNRSDAIFVPIVSSKKEFCRYKFLPDIADKMGFIIESEMVL